MSGTNRSEQERGNRLFGPSFYLFAGLTAVLGAICYVLRGPEVLFDRMVEEFGFLIVIAPRIGAALVIAGFVQVLVPRDLVARWLGSRAGLKGIVIASVAGALTPGGPMTSFPLLVALFASGAHRGSLIAYITGWSLLGVQRVLVWELPLMGGEFTLIRVLACAPLPILAGILAARINFAWAGPAEADQEAES
ncbi:MAG: permease [Hyphomicrobiales bacterium]|nr:permease [Hyphomicrobiales bacterium]